MIAELIAKVGKEASRRGGLPSEALEALEALLLEVDVELIEPSVEHIATAVEMRVRGHRDVFDSLLYATALHEGMKLATEDEGLVGFLRVTTTGPTSWRGSRTWRGAWPAGVEAYRKALVA